jgi:hypothetical protein
MRGAEQAKKLAFAQGYSPGTTLPVEASAPSAALVQAPLPHEEAAGGHAEDEEDEEGASLALALMPSGGDKLAKPFIG